MRRDLFAGVLMLIASNFVIAQTKSKPIISANDFTASTELWDAIGHGIYNFQADVMYIYGKNYVTQLMPDSENHQLPTLADAYLYPLYNQFKKNSGEIIPGYSGDIFLIVNIMGQPVQVYKQLANDMRPFSEMLTYYSGSENHEGKLRILIRDKKQLEMISAVKPSFLGLVGNLADVDKNADSKLMPLIEVDFGEITSWKGIGNIPFEDFTRLKDLVVKVHAQNKKISLMNCPAYKTVADLVQTTKVDFVNTPEAMQMASFFNP